MKRVKVVDSHTVGEPTRVVIAGGPELHGKTLAEKLAEFRDSHDAFRSAVVTEPRGSEVLVGALLCESPSAQCKTGVIFFNNVGVLQMCGHGMIGVVATLAHLGQLSFGLHRFDTPAGEVTATWHEDRQVSITNVPSFRKAANVCVDVAGYGPVSGDVAWGGNWFFLVAEPPFPLGASELDRLTDFAWRVRQAVNAQGYPEVDHVELFGPPVDPKNHSRNFVLCPGKAYDRSPCGTGTSAKVACLAADGQLQPGEVWRQESIIGSVFEATYRRHEAEVLPTIKGTAWIHGEGDLLFDASDPFRSGIPTAAV
ncbi:MAG: proline racemase family protein [Planctomycetaceae bacterium]